MFKSVDLPYIAQSAIMFHKDMPIDWILQSLMRMRFCNNASVWLYQNTVKKKRQAFLKHI